MKKLSIIALFAALLCGVSVYMLLNKTDVEAKEPEPVQETKMVQLVCAAQEIPKYTPISAEMLTLVSVPEEYAPEGAARSIDELLNLQSDGTIYPEELIFLSSVLSEDEIERPLSYSIPDGKEAMTINVTDSSGIGGYITVGDLVDVMQYVLTEETDTVSLGEAVTRTVPGGICLTTLECVEVLAVGSFGYNSEDGLYDTVTLAVSPEQRAVLTSVQAMSGSYITLALRQRDDFTDFNDLTYSEAELLD